MKSISLEEGEKKMKKFTQKDILLVKYKLHPVLLVPYGSMLDEDSHDYDYIELDPACGIVPDAVVDPHELRGYALDYYKSTKPVGEAMGRLIVECIRTERGDEVANIVEQQIKTEILTTSEAIRAAAERYRSTKVFSRRTIRKIAMSSLQQHAYETSGVFLHSKKHAAEIYPQYKHLIYFDGTIQEGMEEIDKMLTALGYPTVMEGKIVQYGIMNEILFIIS